MNVSRVSRIATLCLSIAIAGIASAQPKGDWLGQTPPGAEPLPFAKDFFKTISGFVETCDFSIDGKTCVIGIGNADYSASKMLWSRQVDGVWTKFEPLPFSKDFSMAGEPVFLRDGVTMVFTGTSSTSYKDLFRVEYKNGAWGTPVALPQPINSVNAEYRPCFLPDGSIYFVSDRGGMNAIYKAVPAAAGTYAVSILPGNINTGNWECDAYVADDESYMIFFSAAKSRSSTDPVIVFRKPDGSWGDWIAPPTGFKSNNDEYGAHVSADGKYLFFTRHSKGGNTIYWVSIDTIKALKK